MTLNHKPFKTGFTSLILNIKICIKYIGEEYEQSDIVNDYIKFLTKIKEMKLYFLEFKKDDIIKEKDYFFNWVVGNENCWPIIVISYDEYIFSANDDIWKVWTQVDKTFLLSKSRI